MILRRKYVERLDREAENASEQARKVREELAKHRLHEFEPLVTRVVELERRLAVISAATGITFTEGEP